MIHIFVRHCPSASSVHNNTRPAWFGKERVFQNLLRTSKNEAEISVIFDGKAPPDYLSNSDAKIILVKDGGCEAKSLRFTLNYIVNQKLNDKDIVYLLEDDYVHKDGWANVMQEGFDSISSDYFTLYDHFDKYTPMYNNLQSQILVSKSSHWRTTPSTTNTYACRFATLKRDLSIHCKWADPLKLVSEDHPKFLELWSQGKSLVSCIPGYSTHIALGLMSPCVNWEQYI